MMSLVLVFVLPNQYYSGFCSLPNVVVVEAAADDAVGLLMYQGVCAVRMVVQTVS